MLMDWLHENANSGSSCQNWTVHLNLVVSSLCWTSVALGHPEQSIKIIKPISHFTHIWITPTCHLQVFYHLHFTIITWHCLYCVKQTRLCILCDRKKFITLIQYYLNSLMFNSKVLHDISDQLYVKACFSAINFRPS